MTPVIANPERYLNAGLVPLPPRLKLHPDAPFDQTETQDLSAAIAATRGKHSIGFNVRPNVDYAKLLVQVQAMGGCRAMVFHEYAGNLSKLRPFVEWVDTLIWRPAEWVSERLYLDAAAADWLYDRGDELAAHSLEDAWIHLHNEAGWNQDMLAWEAYASASAVLAGYKVITLNQAVGNPNEQQIALVRPILELAAEYPEQVMIGIHDGYFSVFGDRKYPWYLGRWQATSAELNGGHSYESYRRSIGLGPVRYVFTEAGAEHIRDDDPYTDPLPRTGDRRHVGPVHANDAAWKQAYERGGKVYPGLDTAYLDQLKIAYITGEWDDERIAGVCLFSWGDGGWADYDVSNMGAFLEQLAKWTPRMDEPMEPEPETTDFKAPESVILSADTKLRAGWNTDAAPKTVVPKDTLMTIRRPLDTYRAKYTANGYLWVLAHAVTATEKDGIEGYMAEWEPTLFTPAPPVEEEPPPPKDDDPEPPPPPPDDDPPVGNPTLKAADVRAIVREELASFQAAQNAKLAALLGSILELINTSVAEYSEQKAADSRIITTIMNQARVGALEEIKKLKEIA